MVSQIIGISIISSTVCPGADQVKHQSSSSLAFVRGVSRSLCEGNPSMTSGFHPQRASNGENISIWGRHNAQPSMGEYTETWRNGRRITTNTGPFY